MANKIDFIDKLRYNGLGMTRHNLRKNDKIMKIKRLIIILIALLAVLSSALPAYAAVNTGEAELDYTPENTVTIGIHGISIPVNPDGSFTVQSMYGDSTVYFGIRTPIAESSFQSMPYPISTHEYSQNGIGYKVEQFAWGISADCVCVYSRFTVKNNTDKAIDFPPVMGATAPIAAVPEKVEKNKTASCDYLAFLEPCTDGGAAAAVKGENFNSAREKMISGWDDVLDGILSVSTLSDKHNTAPEEYMASLINVAIGAEFSPSVALANEDYARAVLLSEKADAYAVALALLKTGDKEAAGHHLEAVSAAADLAVTDDGSLPYPTLEENLKALITLQSYHHILKTLSSDDETLADDVETAKGNAAALAKSIAAAIDLVQSDISYDWECTTTDKDAPIILNGKDFASATALCEWYIQSSVFTGVSLKELVALAKDANSYYICADKSEAAILSLISERADGTIIIGRGAPISLLSENSQITVNDVYLSNGSTASISITVKKTQIDISISGATHAPIQVEFPSFSDNIEYSSMGFDSDSGVVTAPEGTTSVSVRLYDSVGTVETERNASATLESAIADAFNTAVETPTTVSKEDFDAALSRAKKARSATADEKLASAENLSIAADTLSPMIAGYTHTVPETDICLGTITKNEVYQKFSLPAAGTVKSLFVKGRYVDGISAAVYTLRGDEYTTDELRAETYGKQEENGIRFDLSFKGEKDTVYVLYIFAENSTVAVDLFASNTDSAYIRESGEIIVYSGASLALDFTVEQVDRSNLDTFYSTCLETNVSNFTKESRKVLSSKLNAARKLLCTPSVTVEEYEKVYDDLKAAYDGLGTYASEDKMEEMPVVGLVLIIIVVILLGATFISAFVSRRRMNTLE